MNGRALSLVLKPRYIIITLYLLLCLEGTGKVCGILSSDDSATSCVRCALGVSAQTSGAPWLAVPIITELSRG